MNFFRCAVDLYECLSWRHSSVWCLSHRQALEKVFASAPWRFGRLRPGVNFENRFERPPQATVIDFLNMTTQVVTPLLAVTGYDIIAKVGTGFDKIRKLRFRKKPTAPVHVVGNG